MINKPVMIITGTRKGIGKYLAEYYSKNEFQVIGCSRGNIDFNSLLQLITLCMQGFFEKTSNSF